MELKTLVAERSPSRKTLIPAITAVIMAVCLTSVFSGCVKEEVPTEATRQLVIPSELEPEAVLPSFGGEIWYECVYEVGNDTNECHDVEFFASLDQLEKGFIKGYVRAYETYTLKSSEEIGIAHPLLMIFVLKYETSEAAEEAFNLFSDWTDLKDTVIDGVKVKWKHDPGEPMVYMLQSNNFIIRIDVSVEPCKDALSRIIELYSVPISKDY